jgi:Ferredoxin
MKLKVNEDACIGCGACAAICPDVYSMNDEGIAYVTTSNIDDNLIEDAIDAKDGCPTAAIIEE